VTPEPRPPAGADLVIPLLALGFAAYFYVSIRDLAWEAKANGLMIGAVLVPLALFQVVRILAAVVRGRAGLGIDPLLQPREALGKRIALVAVCVAFIATLKWLGLTLGLLLGMLAALWAMGVRRRGVLAGISVAVAAAAYALFILALDSEFPHGPIERGLAALF
jgi:hypothetical protein